MGTLADACPPNPPCHLQPQDSPRVRPRCRRMALDWYRVRSPSWNLGSCPYSWGWRGGAAQLRQRCGAWLPAPPAAQPPAPLWALQPLTQEALSGPCSQVSLFTTSSFQLWPWSASSMRMASQRPGGGEDRVGGMRGDPSLRAPWGGAVEAGTPMTTPLDTREGTGQGGESGYSGLGSAGEQGRRPQLVPT